MTQRHPEAAHSDDGQGQHCQGPAQTSPPIKAKMKSVCAAGRKKVFLLLAAAETYAGESAGTEGNQRLYEFVRRCPGRSASSDESQDAAPTVRGVSQGDATGGSAVSAKPTRCADERRHRRASTLRPARGSRC